MRGLISLGIVGLIGLSVAAALALGPRRLEGVLPEPVVDLLEDVAGLVPFGPDAIKAGDIPADFLADTPDGLRATGPIAALPGNGAVFLRDVITDYTTRVASAVPAEVTTIRPIMGCLLTPPLDGTVVGYVTAGQSGLTLGLASYSDADLAAAVQDFVDRYRQDGAAVPEMPAALAYQVYDVAVTETAAPVYLVLEAGAGKRIWNIHLAPGARIERVVLLGGDQVGVANIDPVVPVEVLPSEGLQACGIRPAHPLNAAHRFFRELEADGVTFAEAERRRTEQAAMVEAYARWLRDTFDLDARADRAGFDFGTLSVVGKVPDDAVAKAVYAPISGARILTTQDSFFEIRGQTAEGEDFAARVRAIATSFAYGDLANLMQGADF